MKERIAGVAVRFSVCLIVVALAPFYVIAQAQSNGSSQAGTSSTKPAATETRVLPPAKIEAALDNAGTIRATSQTYLGSGAGAEIDFVPGVGTVRTYDRTNQAYNLLSLNDAVTVSGGAAGKVGIGIAAATIPTFKTEVYHSSNAAGPPPNGLFADTAQFALGLINTDPTTNNYSFISFASTGGGSVKAAVGAQYRSSNKTDLIFGASDGTGTKERMRITGEGAVNVTGTIHATGTITSDGVINAAYQDVAEWVPASGSVEPGTVVVLNLDRRNEVIPSSSTYDTTVAGVVSEHPGISLGKAAPEKAQIATTGRVKVKVDASRAPIQIGDLLVTSDVAGTAMKSQSIEISGRRFHQPGTIIGKALEPLPSGSGEILVLLSLQ